MLLNYSHTLSHVNPQGFYQVSAIIISILQMKLILKGDDELVRMDIPSVSYSLT